MILWTTWVYALRPKLTSLREMSAAHNREDLATIGDHAAGQQVQYDHFAATFELNGWNFGEHIKKPRQYCRGALRYLQWVRRSTHLLSDAIADYLTWAPLCCPLRPRGPWLLAALLTGVNGAPTLLPDNPLGKIQQ